MAVYYVRSTDGNDVDSGLTWALAKATLAGALAVAAAGDRIWVSQAHAETQASAMTLTSAGTAAAPIEILCGNDAAEPPTALATTATITTTGTSVMSFAGFAHVYGITFSSGSGVTNVAMNFISTNSWAWVLDTCSLRLPTTGGTNSRLVIGDPSTTADDQFLRLVNSTIQMAGHAGASVILRGVRFQMFGGSFITTSTPTTVFDLMNGFPVQALLRGVDLSLFGSGKSLVNVAFRSCALVLFQQCKLGASVALTTGTPQGPGGPVIIMDNCDSGDTNYRMQRHQYEGDSYSETTIVRTGGASDGTTGLSHKYVSSANSKFYAPLYGPEMVVWNDAVGSSQTVTCEIVHDSLTNLQDDEVWLETEYLGTSGFPLSLFANDRMADILATPADQAASTETWTTTGLTNPNKQKLVTTQTPQEKGWYRCRVALAKPSYTLYVCPELAVSGVSGGVRQMLVPGSAYINDGYGLGGPLIGRLVR